MTRKIELQDLHDDLLGLMAAVSILMQAASPEVAEAALQAQVDTREKAKAHRAS